MHMGTCRGAVAAGGRRCYARRGKGQGRRWRGGDARAAAGSWRRSGDAHRATAARQQGVHRTAGLACRLRREGHGDVWC
jgi:hypothetical protein